MKAIRIAKTRLHISFGSGTPRQYGMTSDRTPLLKYKGPNAVAKEDDDEKHVHPLQLDIIDRLVELYSNPGEVVLTPFAGVGSEVYSPVSLGRKAVGIELKGSYFKQMTLNLKDVHKRFVVESNQATLFNPLNDAA